MSEGKEEGFEATGAYRDCWTGMPISARVENWTWPEEQRSEC
jgi:hypothetical protein